MAEPPSPIAATQPADPGELATERAGQVATAKGAELREGDFAGDYRIVRRIGGGAMGDVYEGEAEAIGKRVAIKVLKNLAADSDEAAERFLREARAVNKINHPNVLDVFASGKLADGRLFLAMDLLTGESLGEHLRRVGAMDTEAFLDTVEPICRALAAAHAAGVVHRDLKPDNVFLAEQGDDTHVYVLDFGIAKMLSDAAAADGQITLTGEGVWIGTPAYMSPEQWAAEPATPQSDVYALGCTAFEMLTGKVPYQADSVPGIMQKHFNAEPPPLRRADAELPPAFSDAVHAALAKEPEDRPEGAMAFLSALEGVSGGHAHGTKHVRWLAMGLVAAVAAALAFVVLTRGDKNETENEPVADLGGNEGEAAIEPGVPWQQTIVVKPKWAVVRVGDSKAEGEMHIEDIAPDESVFVSAKAIGYSTVERNVTRGGPNPLTIELVPVRSFEGIWKTRQGAMRSFSHAGRFVEVFHQDSVDGDPELIGRFAFSRSDGSVTDFEGAVGMVDSRAPDGDGCKFDLESRYRYDAARDKLRLRRQIAAVRYDPRRRTCTVSGQQFLEWEDLARVKHATSDVRYAVSRGGTKVRLPFRGKQTTVRPPRNLRPTIGNVDGNIGNVGNKPTTNVDKKPDQQKQKLKRPRQKNPPAQAPRSSEQQAQQRVDE